jgi:hypothetical protein
MSSKQTALMALLEAERSSVRDRVQEWCGEQAARRASRGRGGGGVYLVRVRLRGASPAVVRDITVPADTSLLLLHCALQTSLGWNGSAAFHFELPGTGAQECGEEQQQQQQQQQEEEEEEEEEEDLRVADLDSYTDGEAVLDARKVELRDVLYPNEGGGGRRALRYLYDRDRCWEHELELLHPQDAPAAPATAAAPPADPAAPLAIVVTAPPARPAAVLPPWRCLGGSGAPLPEAFGASGARDMCELCAALLDAAHARHGAATAFAQEVVSAAAAAAKAAGAPPASVPTLGALLHSLTARVDADAVTARLRDLGRQHAQHMRELRARAAAAAAAAAAESGSGGDSSEDEGSSDGDGGVDFRAALGEMMREHEQQGGSAAAAAQSGAGGAASAAELGSLRDAGVISDEAHRAATERLAATQ